MLKKILDLMGNALRSLWRDCCNPKPQEDEDSRPPHGITAATAGFSALARDLLQFEVTAQVPEGLSQYVQSSRKAQANWYRKLLEAWKEAKPPPRNAEEASRLILETLQRHRKADVEGLLTFYGLPHLAASVEVSEEVPVPQKWQKGVKYELRTLQVEARAVADGDTITVYVDTKDPRESALVPISVLEAAAERRKARMKRDYERADALQKEISDAGYRTWDASKNGEGEDILAHKYRIRLRGVDAPESQMPYGKQAKEALLNLVEGKCLHILVYDEDRYGRIVGDIYCDGVFVQEVLLKKGCVWHYAQYDKRPEFALWEQEARAARIGLWASSNPQKPWEWRKDKRDADGG